MSESETASPKRQHRLSWVLPALAALRSTVVPAVLFVVFWQGCSLGWLAVLFVVPAIVAGVARHLTTTYTLAPAELIVRRGVFSRNERRIRHTRIQNVDEVQGPVHRLLGLVSVRIETASGGQAEADLLLAPAAVEELRASVFGTRDDEPATTAEPPLLKLPAAELARLGLIRNRGMVVVAAIAGLAYQGFGDFTLDPWEYFGGWVMRLGSDIASGERVPPDLGIVTWIAGLVLLVLGVYLILSVLSMTLAVLRFGGFTLSRQGDDLTARYGLLSRMRITVPRRRIQRLQVDESLFHRIWRRISIRLDTAGGREESDDATLQGADPTRGRQWLAPVTTRARLDDLVAAALPAASRQPLGSNPEAEAGGWRPVQARAVQRLFNRTSLLVLVVTFGLAWATRWSLVIPFIALPPVWWVGRRSIAARRYWPTADALWWRRGWPGRRLVVVPYDKIQSVGVTETPFDRRYGMAGVTVDTAGSGLFPAAQISYLDREEARELARRLAREAGRSEFVWS